MLCWVGAARQGGLWDDPTRAGVLHKNTMYVKEASHKGLHIVYNTKAERAPELRVCMDGVECSGEPGARAGRQSPDLVPENTSGCRWLHPRRTFPGDTIQIRKMKLPCPSIWKGVQMILDVLDVFTKNSPIQKSQILPTF